MKTVQRQHNWIKPLSEIEIVRCSGMVVLCFTLSVITLSVLIFMSHVCFTSVCFLLLFLTYLRPSALAWLVSPVSHSTLSLVFIHACPSLLCQTDCLFSSCQSFVLLAFCALFGFWLCLTCPLDNVYLGFCSSQINACFPFISPASMSCFRSCLQCYHDRFTALWKTSWANSLKNNIHLKLHHQHCQIFKVSGYRIRWSWILR